MVFSIDFNSDVAFYTQLCNQIIFSIANEEIKEGDSLPSVRSLAELIGINMHTVNKAYDVLRQEGFVKIDRRRGAIVALDMDKVVALNELNRNLRVTIARAMCKNISTEEIHRLVDDIINEFSGEEG